MRVYKQKRLCRPFTGRYRFSEKYKDNLLREAYKLYFKQKTAASSITGQRSRSAFQFRGAWRMLHEPCGSFKWKKDH
ncbi:hypothetical protein AMQ84_21680 [Paenibacillus riograndensis]|uniref:Uncharacterized protein n=1 Tax=Paenibacillus riograndensis TaxID=483937 RepID=A0A132TQP7_9BACL|nr:hypothetical protein AMQ84_21680 [Paenibacillus riograndensis]